MAEGGGIERVDNVSGGTSIKKESQGMRWIEEQGVTLFFFDSRQGKG